MDQHEPEATGPIRSQNVVYAMPHDWTAIPDFLTPALERVDPAVMATQLVVITPDAEVAIAASNVALAIAGEDALVVVPVTSAARAVRLVRGRTPHVVAGPPTELLGLVREAALKLSTAREVVIAWADDILAADGESDLEAVMAEVPKEAVRALVAWEFTPAVDRLIERYTRRARRLGVAADGAPGTAPGERTVVGFVTITDATRRASLRRVLDALDPPSVAVYARERGSGSDARRVLRQLGYAEDDPNVQVTEGAVDAAVSLVVLYDLPRSAAEMRTILGDGPRRVVALVQPRQLPALRAAAGSVRPVAFPDAASRARGREETVRRALRAELEAGVPAREILALEPLLNEFDGLELAAAAVRLLERERAATREAAAARAVDRPAPPVSAAAPFARVYINVGTKDDVTVGGVVGAITARAGITSAQIGRIDLRENHAVVEIASDQADRVVERLTGATIRGRRIAARIDRERGPGAAGGRVRGGGGERGGREGRPARKPPGNRETGGDPRRGRNGAARRDAPGRPDRRGPPRRGRDEPTFTQREEWADRGERMRHARRPRGGEDKPTERDG